MAASSTERVGPAQVGRGLQGADGGPLHRGVDLPPVHAAGSSWPRRPPPRRRRAGRRARRSRRPRRRRRSARPARRASRCPRPGRRRGPAPSRARRAGRRARRGGCPGGSRRAPSPAARPAGRCAASQRTPSSSAGRTSPRASRRAAGRPAGRPAAGPSMVARVDGVDGGQGAPALGGQRWRGRRAHSASRRILRGMVSPSSRSTTSQAGADAVVVPSPERHHRGHRARRPPRRRRAGRRSICDPARPGGPSPRSICRMSGRRRRPPVSRSNALVTREAPPESRRRSCTVPPSARAERGRQLLVARPGQADAALLDGDDRPPAVVELVQVLADAVAGLRPAPVGSS